GGRSALVALPLAAVVISASARVTAVAPTPALGRAPRLPYAPPLPLCTLRLPLGALGFQPLSQWAAAGFRLHRERVAKAAPTAVWGRPPTTGRGHGYAP